MRIFLAAFGLGILASASMADNAQIGWSDLLDASTQVFEDPYRDLSPGQLDDLVEVARLRQQVAAGDPSVSAQLAAREAELAENGVDAEWLISQRWVVAERREQAASAGNPELDGAEVTISGFAIPAPPETDGTSVVYLVEQRGMCSHMPPPMPNQMIRVRLVSDWTPEYMHQPVSLTGRLHIHPTQEVFRVVDGEVPMAATWRLDAVAVETYSAAPLAADASSEWVDQLRAKLKANKAQTGE
ncbi:DUF3299 domain-containing protein [Aliiruegeria lutimaris]|uniref:DUF3299 domain-containing protein n=1 Tax=Aliiruegeria lutimaris TaxID=571298 RepID=A0A1G9LQE5_9RHOB|nr:DUF3299 domain-containing protein [Aliiruegeria lutimaris]SDL63987.1 hypothetical protein SAMN04488026_11003 [Aliiruegeria lutimaris]